MWSIWLDTVLSERQEKSKNSKQLNTAIADLTDREKDILFERRLREEPTTLEDLSQRYNISRERVRQIENRAFEKVQTKLLEYRKAS